MTTPSERGAQGTAVAVVLLHGLLAWAWWSAQEFPRGPRDEFFIVELATDIAFGGDWRALLLGDYYPPGLRLPGVLALWMGGSYRGMLAAQALVWLPLLAFGTWWAARKLTSAWGATLAVALLLPAAGISDALHRYEPNLGATAAAAGCLAAFLWSDGLRSRRHVLWFAASLAAGLMVDRLGALPCVALPVAWVAWTGRADPVVRRNVAVIAGVLLVAVGWWYGIFVRDYVAEWLPQLLHGEVGGAGERLEHVPPWPLYLFHYLWLWPDSQVGLVLGSVYLGALGLAARDRLDPDVRRTLMWLLLGLVVFTLIPKRQPFYTLPLLPAAAVLAARAVLGLRWGAVVLAALVTVPTVLTCRPGLLDLHTSGATWALVHRNPLPEWWVGQRFPLGEPPDQRVIDTDALVALLAREGADLQAPVLVLSDDGVISESQLLSRLRISLRSADVQGIVVHTGGAEAVADRAGALVDLHRGLRGYPDRAAIVDAYAARFGWEDQEDVVHAVLRQAPRARAVLHDQLPSSTWLTVYVLRPAR